MATLGELLIDPHRLAVLREVARSVVVVTRSSGRLGEIEALGTRVIDFDFHRASSQPLREAQSAWALARRGSG